MRPVEFNSFLSEFITDLLCVSWFSSAFLVFLCFGVKVMPRSYSPAQSSASLLILIFSALLCLLGLKFTVVFPSWRVLWSNPRVVWSSKEVFNWSIGFFRRRPSSTRSMYSIQFLMLPCFFNGSAFVDYTRELDGSGESSLIGACCSSSCKNFSVCFCS